MGGKPGPMLGKHHTEETKRKMSEIHMGHPVSTESRQRISLAKLGKKLSEEIKRKISEAHLGRKRGPPTEEHKRKMSEAHLGKQHTEESKSKMRGRIGTFLGRNHTEESKRKISANSGRRGKPGTMLSKPGTMLGKHHTEETKKKMRENYNCKPHKVLYKDIWFRSSWEAKVAEYLDKIPVSWLYEPHVFTLVIDGKETTYRPDFYLPELGVYHEVKGYARPGLNNCAKVLAAREQHGLNITVIDYRLLKRLGVI